MLSTQGWRLILLGGPGKAPYHRNVTVKKKTNKKTTLGDHLGRFTNLALREAFRFSIHIHKALLQTYQVRIEWRDLECESFKSSPGDSEDLPGFGNYWCTNPLLRARIPQTVFLQGFRSASSGVLQAHYLMKQPALPMKCVGFCLLEMEGKDIWGSDYLK